MMMKIYYSLLAYEATGQITPINSISLSPSTGVESDSEMVILCEFTFFLLINFFFEKILFFFSLLLPEDSKMYLYFR